MIPKNWHSLIAGLGIAVGFTGCGSEGIRIADRVVMNLNPDAGTGSIQFILDSQTGVELETEGAIEILDPDSGRVLGSIEFVPGGWESPASIVLTAHYSEFVGALPITASIATTLPNGTRFPSSVVPPIYRLSLTSPGAYDPIFYISADPYVQFGLGLVIKQMNQASFPVGLSLTQLLRDGQGRPVASVSLFGPSADRSVAGGLYFHVNFGPVAQAGVINDVITASGTQKKMMTIAQPKKAAAKASPVQNLIVRDSVQEILDPKKQMPADPHEQWKLLDRTRKTIDRAL